MLGWGACEVQAAPMSASGTGVVVYDEPAGGRVLGEIPHRGALFRGAELVVGVAEDPQRTAAQGRGVQRRDLARGAAEVAPAGRPARRVRSAAAAGIPNSGSSTRSTGPSVASCSRAASVGDVVGVEQRDHGVGAEPVRPFPRGIGPARRR